METYLYPRSHYLTDTIRLKQASKHHGTTTISTLPQPAANNHHNLHPILSQHASTHIRRHTQPDPTRDTRTHIGHSHPLLTCSPARTRRSHGRLRHGAITRAPCRPTYEGRRDSLNRQRQARRCQGREPWHDRHPARTYHTQSSQPTNGAHDGAQAGQQGAEQQIGTVHTYRHGARLSSAHPTHTSFIAELPTHVGQPAQCPPMLAYVGSRATMNEPNQTHIGETQWQ